MRYKLVFQNDIGRVEFSTRSGVIVSEVSSFGGQKVSFDTTQSNREIGEKLEHQNVNPKTISVRGTITGDSDAMREQMKHVIAPLSAGKLIYEDVYELDVYVKSSPDIERYQSNAKFGFSLFAPYPYWRKKDASSTTLVGLRPLFHFPWNISDPNPFAFSEYVEVGYINVKNDGEAPAYWTVTFSALDEVTNPRIYNMETGEYVRILKTMNTGEQLVISTDGEELTVTLVGSDGMRSDGFEYLDIESEPFTLAVGDNFIKTDAEINTSALRASISYRPAFVGV